MEAEGERRPAALPSMAGKLSRCKEGKERRETTRY
jgi:hypothetical protein